MNVPATQARASRGGGRIVLAVTAAVVGYSRWPLLRTATAFQKEPSFNWSRRHTGSASRARASGMPCRAAVKAAPRSAFRTLGQASRLSADRPIASAVLTRLAQHVAGRRAV
jgi:hypothetical protein